MNEFHRQIEKEQQDRKYRDLEIRFHESERELDSYKVKYRNTVKLLSDKTVELQSFKEEIVQSMLDTIDKIRNL